MKKKYFFIFFILFFMLSCKKEIKVYLSDFKFYQAAFVKKKIQLTTTSQAKLCYGKDISINDAILRGFVGSNQLGKLELNNGTVFNCFILKGTLYGLDYKTFRGRVIVYKIDNKTTRKIITFERNNGVQIGRRNGGRSQI